VLIEYFAAPWKYKAEFSDGDKGVNKGANNLTVLVSSRDTNA